MKKTYILTVDYDEGVNLLEKLHITDERAHELIKLAEEEARARNEGTPDKPFDSFISLIDLLETNSLNGNEIFFYLINGYTINMKMQM